MATFGASPSAVHEAAALRYDSKCSRIWNGSPSAIAYASSVGGSSALAAARLNVPSENGSLRVFVTCTVSKWRR